MRNRLALIALVFAGLAAGPPAWGSLSFFCGGTTLSDGTVLPTAAKFPIDLCTPVNQMVSGFAMTFDHRDYLPATGLGTLPGLMFGLEVTLVNMPTAFQSALGSLGNVTLPISFLPSIRAHLAKGIGPVDISASGFYFPGLLQLGGAVKWAFWQKDEGPSYAARVGYAYSNISFPPTGLSGQPLFQLPFSAAFITHTITPVLMMSRKLNIGVEPYIGAGAQFALGGISLSMPVPAELAALTKLTSISDFIPGFGFAGIGFVGLAAAIPYVGLGITIEMQYSTAGASSMGFNLGFTF